MNKADFIYSVTLVAGNSGDGIQALGHQLSYAHARYGHIVQTLADFPAEIRAPAGTIEGVSGFSLAFSSSEQLLIVPQKVDIAIVFNPAAYRSIAERCSQETLIIFDSQKWTEKDLKKARYSQDPLQDRQGMTIGLSLSHFSQNELEHLPETVSSLAAMKNKNMTALGLTLWLHELPLDPTLDMLHHQFSKKLQESAFLELLACVKAGYYLGETLEIGPVWKRKSIPIMIKTQKAHHQTVPMNTVYSQITGHQSLVLGMLKACEFFRKPLLLSGYPITPASDLLHLAHKWESPSLCVFQAEDEISAAGVALGAAYAGSLALTCTSGPGFDLKAEMMGLGVMAEVPFVIINIQRGGPSTGLPTKVEQSDILAALWGRHGDCPIPVLAHNSAAQGIDLVKKAFSWAIEAMTPVIILSDALVALNAEKVALMKSDDSFVSESLVHDEYPWNRSANAARPWTLPGYGAEPFCLGGLEKDRDSGKISYDSVNHEIMTQLRREKILSLAICAQPPTEPLEKRYLWIGFGASAACIGHFHHENQYSDSTYWIIEDLFPLPKNFWEIAQSYKYIIVAELSDGQFVKYLRSYGNNIPILSYSQLGGQSLDLNKMQFWFEQIRIQQK